ncbi:regulator of microtubule dynamics protein 1 isoform X3 [Rhineura floridana]|uniref:regulator of microtubule dynamics protein 1 isoform X3 n=1 Tax=Rhineura floridana TaxID=261503 RepID=UPI002AC81BAB|nr:regulator of microtubule dynamics protein 1 isoform X3 [Rhineura floridana]
MLPRDVSEDGISLFGLGNNRRSERLPGGVEQKVLEKSRFFRRGLAFSALSYLGYEAYIFISHSGVVHADVKVDEVLDQADYLYGSGETEKLYQLLDQYKNSENAELLWRLARASRDLAQLSHTSAEKKKQLTYEALHYAKKALNKNPSSFSVHKWYAICISDVGDYEGIKTKIANAFIIQEHFQAATAALPRLLTNHLLRLSLLLHKPLPPLSSLPPSLGLEPSMAPPCFLPCFPPAPSLETSKLPPISPCLLLLTPPPPRQAAEAFTKAVELNPKDATSLHLMGIWCYTFAEMPWYQSKIAAVLFSTPPSSTYEEALRYFQKAEDVEPNFYSKNLLFLGKTYMKLNNRKMALLWLTKAKERLAHTEEDKQVQKEAVELLNSL